MMEAALDVDAAPLLAMQNGQRVRFQNFQRS